MKASEIVIPKAEDSQQNTSKKSKLSEAYQHERSKLELTEIELNRSKLVFMDEQGNISRFSQFSEH